MKSLVEYIIEGKSGIFEEIKSLTFNTIDYLYNEGIVMYDDKHLVKYSEGELETPFDDIIKAILEEGNISSKTQIVLKNYLKNGPAKDKTSAVQNAILAAISEFVEKGNCKQFI